MNELHSRFWCLWYLSHRLDQITRIFPDLDFYSFCFLDLLKKVPLSKFSFWWRGFGSSVLITLVCTSTIFDKMWKMINVCHKISRIRNIFGIFIFIVVWLKTGVLYSCSISTCYISMCFRFHFLHLCYHNMSGLPEIQCFFPGGSRFASDVVCSCFVCCRCFCLATSLVLILSNWVLWWPKFFSQWSFLIAFASISIGFGFFTWWKL